MCCEHFFLLAEHFILWTFSVGCANGIVYFWSFRDLLGSWNCSCNMQSRAMHHISKAFTVACSKLEKIGNVETNSDAAASESKTQKEAIDLKELKRIDHILSSLKRKVICFFFLRLIT